MSAIDTTHDASALGWPPGHFPLAIEIDEQEFDLLELVYVNVATGTRIVVNND